MCAICALWQPVLASGERRLKSENAELGRNGLGAPMNSMRHPSQLTSASSDVDVGLDGRGQARIWRSSYLTMTALPEHVEGLDALARVPEACVGELAGVCACVV